MWSVECVLEMKPYIAKCLFLCWMMVVQNPPMSLNTDAAEGKQLNSDMYRTYTKNGKYVDFLVWPALLLHEHGPTVCKGIAQGKQ